ncbi:MFS transporter [Streptomyces sp. NBC_01465]|uniref:MFS transporter n=1 Tax=Streptomyces sp. NBC_01465 TaxID=2903878 RepID=UPI002E338072|nr:MFS transporter [Streptomyces sp. NBC_01465]
MTTADPTRKEGRSGPHDGGAIRLPASTSTSPTDRTQAPKTVTSPDTSQAPAASAPPAHGNPHAPHRRLWAYAHRHPVIAATVVSAVTHVIWFLFFANSGGDLAAQDAWAEFVGRHPASAYNLAWYGGMHPVSYSVVSPYLMAVIGVRPTMMLAGTVSAALTALILCRVKAVRNPLACALAADFAFLCNALSGRVTFGLGTMFALGAVAAVFCWPHKWRYHRWGKAWVAAPLAALATASSPVAGLYLGVVAAALFLNKRRPGAYALGLAPVAVVAASSLLFPFSGTQPMSVGTASLPFLYGVLVFFLVPKEWKTVRVGAAVYAVGVLLTWAVDSQIGSNISRFAMLFAGVILMAALPYTAPRTPTWWIVLIAFAGLNFWIGFKGVDDIVRTAPTASWTRELAPLVAKLQDAGAEKGRVEVVPASSHREASALPQYVNLARGWTRQADMKRNPLFYDGTLNATSYRAWLDRWAVHYVVLPTGAPDASGAVKEAKLVAGGLPYLKTLWSDANWQLFKVEDPTPMADPPGTVERAEDGELTLDVKSPGWVLIRIPYSRWLAVVDEKGDSLPAPKKADGSDEFRNIHGCLRKAEKTMEGDEWTQLLAPKAGVYRLASPYQLPPGTGCPEELQ